MHPGLLQRQLLGLALGRQQEGVSCILGIGGSNWLPSAQNSGAVEQLLDKPHTDPWRTGEQVPEDKK